MDAETFWRRAGLATQTVSVLRVQAAGYRVELLAVATLNPRFVSDSYHDEAAKGLADRFGNLPAGSA
jgi:hypothetical protein